MAAGRYTSADTSSTFLRCSSLSRRASLPAVVVLPAPCKPAISTTAGGTAARLRLLFCVPISSVSAWLTTPIKAWPGVRLPITSWPTARSFTLAIKSFTTGSATSASNSAMRTSRRASLMLSSERRAWPRIFLAHWLRRPDRLSNIVFLVMLGNRPNAVLARFIASGFAQPINGFDSGSDSGLVHFAEAGRSFAETSLRGV